MSVCSLVQQYAVPTLVLDITDREARDRLCTLGMHVLQMRCTRLLQSNIEDPVLVIYGSDCTPLVTKETFRRCHDGTTVIRRGRRSAEYLIQRLFVKTSDGRNGVIVAPPLRMGCKTVWAHFKAFKDFFDHPRRQGHRGLEVLFSLSTGPSNPE